MTLFATKQFIKKAVIIKRYTQGVTKKGISKLEMGVTTMHFENRWITKGDTIIWLEWTSTFDLETGMQFA